jgi:hypothetical protein
MGAPGKPGASGAPGKPGEPGARGPQGPKGADGLSVLSRLDPIAPGTGECDAGGVTILMGRDRNRDEKLSDDEIEQSQDLCNPEADQQSAWPLIDIVAIESGGLTCPDGGVYVRVGIDDGEGDHAGNNILDDDEVDNANPVCLGPAGGAPSGSCSVAAPGGRNDGIAAVWLLGFLLTAATRLRRRAATKRAA